MRFIAYSFVAAAGLFALAPLACSSTNAEEGGDGGASSTSSSSSSGDVDGSVAKACTMSSECESKVCKDGKCQAPTATDGTQNGTETDVDCGGASAPPCGDQMKCAASTDCKSGVCKDKVCASPAPNDGVKNGDETDVDCGGAKAPKCDDGKGCAKREDCTSDICVSNKCGAPKPNGVKDGTETDIDCGGPTAPRCDDTKACLGDGDCKSDVCTGAAGAKTCQVPTPTDMKKNGVETDVDCGGAGNPTCDVGKACLVHADCTSDGCAYNNKCAPRRSCTGQYGGDTCGLGGAGGQGAAQWESCCATAPAGAVQLGKYKVTSGRMREFIKRTNGNVRQAVKDARAKGFPAGVTFPETYDLYLPNALDGCDQLGNCAAEELTDKFYDEPGAPTPYQPFKGIFTSVYRHLGGNMFNGQGLPQQGCQVSGNGAHTYWMDAGKKSQYFGDVPAEHSQAIYDTKALNCVNYLMAQAFCLWDGGRLETFAEWLSAWGPAALPWGAGPTPWGPTTNSETPRFPAFTDAQALVNNPAMPANRTIEQAVYLFSYEYPARVTTDYVVFMPVPGRVKGRGPNGHADIVGGMMEVTSDVNTNTGDPRTSRMNWTTNGSFEGHGWGKGITWSNFSLVHKYGKQGLRCAYP